MPKLNDTIRVNVLSIANVAEARDDIRNGRKVKIVPSATMPDNVVMNGIKYPAEEIEKGYLTLNRTPAPYGHPIINGQYVSAFDPEAINHSFIGAWNENARRVNGRVLLDKVIDIETAMNTEKGREVLNAIEKGEPVHTSTGLTATLDAPDGEDHEYIARNLAFDHDAILLHEQGAATPEQGVGMLVNGTEVVAINSAVEWADQELDWAVRSAYRALEEKAKQPILDRIKAALAEAFGLETGQRNSADKGDADMADDKRLEELKGQVETLGNAVSELTKSLPTMIADAVKPATEMVANMKAEQEAKDAAELADLRNKLVESDLIDEDGAKELTLNAARALAKKVPPKKGALGLNNRKVEDTGTDPLGDYDINATVDAVNGKKEA